MYSGTGGAQDLVYWLLEGKKEGFHGTGAVEGPLVNEMDWKTILPVVQAQILS